MSEENSRMIANVLRAERKFLAVPFRSLRIRKKSTSEVRPLYSRAYLLVPIEDRVSMTARQDLVRFHHVTLERVLFAQVASITFQREQQFRLRILFQSHGASMRVWL